VFVAASFQKKNMIFLMVISIALGIGAALYLQPEGWGVLRTILLGAFGGAGCGYLVIASRALGAFDVPDDPTR
jgi:hypothetical protein